MSCFSCKFQTVLVKIELKFVRIFNESAILRIVRKILSVRRKTNIGSWIVDDKAFWMKFIVPSASVLLDDAIFHSMCDRLGEFELNCTVRYKILIFFSR